VASATLAFAQGPIAPTEDLESKHKTSTQPVDLPYRPQSIDELFSTDTTTGTGTSSAGSTGTAIDWSKMPFIPSKTPPLVAAPDPEI
jgi:hypothetical protein